MYAESDRVLIRKYLGYSSIFLQQIPVLESAITATMWTADGGTRPDNSTELAIKGYLTQLQTIEQKLINLYDVMIAISADSNDIEVDPLRGMHGLFRLGRVFVGFLADAMSTNAVRDVFSPKAIAQLGASNISVGSFDR